MTDRIIQFPIVEGIRFAGRMFYESRCGGRVQQRVISNIYCRILWSIDWTTLLIRVQ